jgi:hypothetical protein
MHFAPNSIWRVIVPLTSLYPDRLHTFPIVANNNNSNDGSITHLMLYGLPDGGIHRICVYWTLRSSKFDCLTIGRYLVGSELDCRQHCSQDIFGTEFLRLLFYLAINTCIYYKFIGTFFIANASQRCNNYNFQHSAKLQSTPFNFASPPWQPKQAITINHEFQQSRKNRSLCQRRNLIKESFWNEWRESKEKQDMLFLLCEWAHRAHA